MSAKAPHLRKGEAAEALAERWLQAKGLTRVDRNFRCKSGEIDLIMQDEDALVFVEVRYRSHTGFGSAIDSVTPAKQQKLLRSAQHYLQQLGHTPACRFDIIGIDRENRIQWIRNAFQ
ncbi:MAG TPA: YraN family protein [Chromatiaceae bacterium]|nr:YraN family protein [Chromatiaceae bacterium]